MQTFRKRRAGLSATAGLSFILQTMRPDIYDAQSTHQHVPILSNPVGAVSDVQCDSGGGQALSFVYPVTEPPTPQSVAFPPQTYYVTTLGVGASTPAAVTTSATPWQPAQYIAPPVSRPVAAGTFGTPPKPEMTFLFPVCMPSSEAGHVMSPPTSVGRSPTLVTTPPATSGLNPPMNITKYVALFFFISDTSAAHIGTKRTAYVVVSG